MFKSNDFILTGRVNCTAHIDLISCDMEAVIKDAFLIMVTTPAQYHTIVAAAMSPYLKNGQAVLLNPGRTFGTYVFDKALKDNGCKAKVFLGETDTFVFTCRCLEAGKPIIYEIKNELQLASHRREDAPYFFDVVAGVFDRMKPVPNIFYTGFSNVGMVFHPLPILMNITRVEAKEDFLFYIEGISPLVASVLEQIDAERVGVAKAFGVEILSAMEWLKKSYGSEGDSLYERIQNTNAYKKVLAPTDIDTRYIFEDILTGCVPTSCVAKILEVDTDVIDATIKWSSVLYKQDHHALGRNADKIDFRALFKEQLN